MSEAIRRKDMLLYRTITIKFQGFDSKKNLSLDK